MCKKIYLSPTIRVVQMVEMSTVLMVSGNHEGFDSDSDANLDFDVDDDNETNER